MSESILCQRCGIRFDSTLDLKIHQEGMCVETEARILQDVFRPDETDFQYFMRRLRFREPIRPTITKP